MARPSVIAVLLVCSSVDVQRTAGFQKNTNRFPPIGPPSVTTFDVFVAGDQVHVVDERFLSVAIGVDTIYQLWKNVRLSSAKLQTLTRALAPAFLRLGGTAADFLIFSDPCPNKTSLRGANTSFEHHEQLPAPTKCLCPKEWNDINKFCVDTGLQLIFGLNLLLRTNDGRWNSTNAEQLLNFNAFNGVAWELGNEPNAYSLKANLSLNGSQLGRDFSSFRAFTDTQPRYRAASIFGPDISEIGKTKTSEMLSSFLQETTVNNATTFHSYYLNGHNATVDQFLDPETLDGPGQLPDKIKLVRSLVTKYRGEGAPVWLGETGSAYGGGTPNLSDRYVAGFLFLDKLGMSAKMGVSVVIRQTYYGGDYTMLDLDNLDPKPDYWIAYIYKMLVGTRVLDANIDVTQMLKEVRSQTDKNYVRVYAHCTATSYKGYNKGAVTLIIMNMNKVDSASIKFQGQLAWKTITQYLLTSYGPKGMRASRVRLNGRTLQLKDDTTLPKLNGFQITGGNPVTMPPLTYGFFVVNKARFNACIS